MRAGDRHLNFYETRDNLVLASAIAMYKPAACRLAASVGVSLPAWTLVRPDADPEREAQRIVDIAGETVFVKPTSGGGSLGAGLCRGVRELVSFLVTAPEGTPLIASTYIDGIDVSVGLLSDDKGTLQPLPILATYYDRDFYDYEAKHNLALRRHECPAQFPDSTNRELADSALKVAAALGITGVARVDFLVDANDRPWFLEVNTIPGMSRNGNLAQMAVASGLSYEGLVLSVLKTAGLKTGYTP